MTQIHKGVLFACTKPMCDIIYRIILTLTALPHERWLRLFHSIVLQGLQLHQHVLCIVLCVNYHQLFVGFIKFHACVHVNTSTTSSPSVLSTALIKMSLTDPDSPRRTLPVDNHHSNLVETIANCPQAIKDLSAVLMLALVSNLKEIATGNRSLLCGQSQILILMVVWQMLGVLGTGRAK